MLLYTNPDKFFVARHRSKTLGSVTIPNWPPGKDFVTDNSQDSFSHMR